MLTLEKFEEATELVKRVTNPTKLIYSDYLSEQSGSIPGRTRSAGHITRSAR